jgi:hypothetical protein
MAKHKVSAKAVAADIASGMDEAGLMEKYGLTPKALAYVLQKLFENNVITASQVSQIRQSCPETDSSQSQNPSTETLPNANQAPIDQRKEQAIAEDVRRGTHDYDIRMRFHLSPSELRVVMDDLVRLGYLSREEAEARRSEKGKQCPYCFALVRADADKCEKCERALATSNRTTRPVRPDTKSEPTAREAPLEEQVCAWEDYSNNRGTRGLFRAFFVTVWQCITSPAAFFAHLPLATGYSAPAMFGSFCATVPLVFLMVFIAVLQGIFSEDGIGALIMFAGIVFLVGFVVSGLGLYLVSGVIHGCLKLFGGNEKPFQATFRVVSYAQAASLFGFIPVIGGLVGPLLAIYLTGVGIRETHKPGNVKAFAAVGIPTCGFAVLSALVLLNANPWEDLPHSPPLPALQLKTIASSSGTEFSSYAGKFTVSSPVTLKETKCQVKTALGKADALVFTGQGASTLYMVVYVDTQPQIHYLEYIPFFSRSYDPQKMLDDMPDGVARRFGGNLIGFSRVVLDGNPGREIMIQAPKRFGEDVRMKVRVFLVKNKVYEIAVIAQNDKLNTKEVNDFLDSLEIHS